MKTLKIIPLGGLGEVGLNLMVIECNEDIYLIDCGVLFPDLFWMGLDLVVPDFSYLLENKDRIKALLVTHGHEDHIGAIPYLLKEVEVPNIYSSQFAGELIKESCSEVGVSDKLNLQTVKAGDKISVGQSKIEFIHVTHSTLESFALAIDTPHGLIIHSGDFKFDETPYKGAPSDKNRFAELGKQKPLLLLSDSTNSEKSGRTCSESSIHGDLEKAIVESEGATIVALFASNIHRVHQFFDIAKKLGKKVFLSGRSMVKYVRIATEQNLLPLDTDLVQPLENLSLYDRKDVLVLSTGSQGEARSSLIRLARNEHRYLKIKPGDTVLFSSSNIPGNEKAISFVINELFRLGANVVHDRIKNVHVTGHAQQEEQLELLKMIQPQYFIPVHGEYRHLVTHKKTADQSGFVKNESHIVTNGQVWQWSPSKKEVTLGEEVISGRRWSYRGEVGSMDSEPIRDKKKASRGGVISVSCLTTSGYSSLVKKPQVELRGVLCPENRLDELKKQLSEESALAFDDWKEDNHEGLTREQWVARGARRVMRRWFDSKPLVVVSFLTQSR